MRKWKGRHHSKRVRVRTVSHHHAQRNVRRGTVVSLQDLARMTPEQAAIYVRSVRHADP